jgi:hypothetical protein
MLFTHRASPALGIFPAGHVESIINIYIDPRPFPSVFLIHAPPANMSDIKTAEGLGHVPEVSEKAGDHHTDVTDYSLKVQDKTEVCGDINNVAALGLANTAELEKRIVRKLDTWMLPQLWILYMFNYLNRTNIAQARLNTFDQDLNLQDGDYQVSLVALGFVLS